MMVRDSTGLLLDGNKQEFLISLPESLGTAMTTIVASKPIVAISVLQGVVSLFPIIPFLYPVVHIWLDVQRLIGLQSVIV